MTLPGAGHPGQRRGTQSRRADESCWSGRPGTGPTPPGSCNSAQPLRRAGALSAAGASRAGPTSAGGWRRAPAACWCARTTVASAATVHPRPAPHRNPPAAGPGSSPRSHPLTSGDAGYRPSSSSRTAPADPATGTPSGSGTRSRRSPPGGHSTGAPAADAQAAAAPAAPTPHQSGHASSADHHPRGNPTGNDPPRSTGHALAGTEEPTVADADLGRSRHPPGLRRV